MSSPLFRQEVLDAQSAQYLGGIRIGRNPRHATVAAVALLLAGALVVVSAWVALRCGWCGLCGTSGRRGAQNTLL